MARRKSGLFAALILIALGVVFLLENLDLLEWDAWGTVVRLWPVIFILFGLSMLLGVRSAVGELREINQALEGATQARVEIAPGVSKLSIGALDEPGQLIQGAVAVGRHQDCRANFRLQGDTAHFKLKSQEWAFFPFFGGWRRDFKWGLYLSQAVPMRLKVNAGVGQCSLDLQDLNLTRLDLDAGVGEVGVTLPRRGQLEARLKGGVGSLTVRVPAEMAARIRVSTGLGSARVRGDFQRQGRRYVSPGYDTAENRVDLRVDSGIGEIVVRQI
jgi:hypothetical protein